MSTKLLNTISDNVMYLTILYPGEKKNCGGKRRQQKCEETHRSEKP